MYKVNIKAFAKVNLYLGVTGKRHDGYHTLDTVMMSVGLADKLVLERRNRGVKLYCTDEKIPTDERNICYKAAMLFFQKTGVDSGVTIRITKKIPSCAGLGGGSSDAAATLNGLCRLFDVKLDNYMLKSMARELGADVTFCLEGGVQLLCGAGDDSILTLPLPKKHLCILKPDCGISTPDAYRTLDVIKGDYSGDKSSSWELVDCLNNRKKFGMKEMKNDFESTLPELAPECLELLRELRTYTPDALLSGSGTAIFGLFDLKKDRDEAFRILTEKHPDMLIFKAEPVSCGSELGGLE